MCKAIISECYGLFLLGDRCSIFKEFYGTTYLMPNSPDRKFLMKLFKPHRAYKPQKEIKNETEKFIIAGSVDLY
jgi:hypothetical protein